MSWQDPGTRIVECKRHRKLRRPSAVEQGHTVGPESLGSKVISEWRGEKKKEWMISRDSIRVAEHEHRVDLEAENGVGAVYCS